MLTFFSEAMQRPASNPNEPVRSFTQRPRTLPPQAGHRAVEGGPPRGVVSGGSSRGVVYPPLRAATTTCVTMTMSGLGLNARF